MARISKHHLHIAERGAEPGGEAAAAIVSNRRKLAPVEAPGAESNIIAALEHHNRVREIDLRCVPGLVTGKASDDGAEAISGADVSGASVE